MNFVFSSTILASVFAPAVSFGYLDQLGGAPVAPAAAVSAPPAYAAAPEPAAPAATYESGFADVELSATSSGYLDSMNVGEEISGAGIATHVDGLNTGFALQGGAGINTYAANLPGVNALQGGGGINTHVDTLSPSDFDGASFSPFGASAPASFSGSTSADGVSFTLETGDISGLVDGLGPGQRLRLSGSIDNISYN